MFALDLFIGQTNIDGRTTVVVGCDDDFIWLLQLHHDLDGKHECAFKKNLEKPPFMFGAEFGEKDATGQSDLVNTVLTNVLRTLTPTVGAANVENIPFRGRHGNLPC